RVAIVARNLPEWAITFWATMNLGAIAVPLNAWWSSDEIAYGLADSGASLAVVDAARAARISPALASLPDLRHLLVLTDGTGPPPPATTGRAEVSDFAEVLGSPDAAATPPDAAIDPDDDATIFYTSGTTGRPKGAVGTHRNAVTNLMNLFFNAQRSTVRFGAGAFETSDEPNSTLLSVPLFHATGCLVVLVVSAASGGKIVMTHHFDAGQALELIERERITGFGGVPTVALQVLDRPDIDSFDTTSVRSVWYGGAPSPPELVRRILERFPTATPSNGYGLTETSAGVASNAGPDYVQRPDSCGPVVPVCDAAIVPEGHTDPEPPDPPLAPGTVGELWIKGPSVVRGYWNKPDETAAAFTRGWLRTGDLARLDDEGYLYIVDRAKDVIIRGGENVYSVIVEAAIFEHPDVADCAVVGLPHPTLGEEVCAVVVLRPGRTLDAEAISRHVAQRLGRFEVPTRVVFRAEGLPRNPQGKVLKRDLRLALAGASADAER
ncbi:MAG TPA: class I adenylate-forming enzyme family protein, partial [Acidimicrobiales bacterium]|nr:class I adenylate-forming enzyme family protein [Acidimicrobiales bacterium]